MKTSPPSVSAGAALAALVVAACATTRNVTLGQRAVTRVGATQLPAGETVGSLRAGLPTPLVNITTFPALPRWPAHAC